MYIFLTQLGIDILSIQADMQLNANGSSLWEVNIGVGDDLMSSGSKSLSESVFTNISEAIRCH